MNCENIIQEILGLPAKIELRKNRTTGEYIIFTYRNANDIEPTDYWYAERNLEKMVNKYKNVKLCNPANPNTQERHENSRHIKWVM